MSISNEPRGRTSQTTSTENPARPRRRWRGVVVGTLLFVTGGIAGALIAVPTAVFSQGWGGPGPGMMHDFGPMRGMHGGAFGALPGPIGGHLDMMLSSINATPEQRDKMKPILERTADQLFELRGKHLEGRKQIRDTLAAASIDRAKLDSLRAQQMQLADAASKIITNAVADAADVLTPEQRAELARRIERRERWFRG
ncbi:MAG TPA: Spy/CpxP family protein refolding chaperone [Pseudolabrys sp.]|nr:Spy/CpxP family protein refolding chaperone [Pseudolabrys sp.]